MPGNVLTGRPGSGVLQIRIVRVLAPNPGVYTLEGTNTWILGSEPAVVIDPGPDDADHLVEVARTAGRIGAIVLTHLHEDHGGGAAALSARTGAPVHALRPPKGCERLRDGQPVRSGRIVLLPVHTPGHTPDHVSFFVDGGRPQERALFTGDAVLGRGTSVIDPPEGELGAYLRSLRRMLELDPTTIYPGHGPVVFDAKMKLGEYLAHRAEREDQVIAALSDGPRTIAELVENIYSGYPMELHPLAARSVLAHLKKLEGEGRADHTGRGRSIRYEAAEPHACERCGRPAQGRAKLCERCSLAVLQEPPEA